MSFAQAKLTILAAQSIDGSNLYSYIPANGDTLADVTTSGYFYESRFIGSDGWINGYLFCVLADGTFIIQIGATGATAAYFGGGGSTPQLVVDVALLRSNMSGSVTVDMGADDYTMTDTESQASIIVVTNVGDGTKTLTWPAPANGTYPSQQIIVTYYATNTFKVMSSGYFNATITPNIVNQVVVNGTLGIIDLGQIVNGTYNGQQILAAGNTNFAIGMVGKTLVANDVLPQTLTINTGITGGNIKFYVSAEDTGDLTIVAGAGVTLKGGVTTIATGQSAQIQRVGLSETYRIMVVG